MIKSIKLVCISLLLSVFCAPLFAADIKTNEQKYSYAIGFQIGNNLKNENVKVDVDLIAQAIKDVMGGKDLKVSMEEMQAAVLEIQKQQQEERLAQGKKSKEAGEKFLAENKKKKGIKTLENGIQYKVLTKGKGDKPKPTDTVEVHYKGTLIDGKEFDSSYSRGQPATFGVNQVIKGWQEVLPMMKTGAKWQVYIPADLAYGARGAGANIGPNETLIFDIELLKIVKK